MIELWSINKIFNKHLWLNYDHLWSTNYPWLHFKFHHVLSPSLPKVISAAHWVNPAERHNAAACHRTCADGRVDRSGDVIGKIGAIMGWPSGDSTWTAWWARGKTLLKNMSSSIGMIIFPIYIYIWEIKIDVPNHQPVKSHENPISMGFEDVRVIESNGRFSIAMFDY